MLADSPTTEPSTDVVDVPDVVLACELGEVEVMVEMEVAVVGERR